MSEAVTVPNLMMILISFRGIACEGHRQTDRQKVGSVIFLKVCFANKKKADSAIIVMIVGITVS